MIIERQISPYTITSSQSISDALKKISNNKSRFVLCVSEKGHLEGIFTDGDFRRWMGKQAVPDLATPVLEAANLKFLSLSSKSSAQEIEKLLSDKITFIPLVDNEKHLIAIAKMGEQQIRIGQRSISDEDPTFIIAEIGINHNGSLEIAKRMIDEAVEAGADCAKFQMRNLKELYRNAGDPNDAREDLGSQYTLDILSKSQLTIDEMFEAFDYCRSKNIIPLCTPWDLASVSVLEAYGMEAYKIASADLTNHDLLRAVAATGKPMLISTGMSTEQEIIECVGLMHQCAASFLLLHCNSTYPAPFKDVHLAYLDRLRELSGFTVGYSGHERGYAVPIAAVARGARVIEKHFTLDCSMEGNDHKVSLEPLDFKKMVEAIRQVEESLGEGAERTITQGELMNRESLAKSIIASCSIPKGSVITEDMLEIKSPGKGLQPNKRNQLIGKTAKRSMKAGDFFYLSDLCHANIEPRAYNFKRPWGLPVRYHDWEELSGKSNLDFVEFHFSFKDLELDFKQFFKQPPRGLNLVTHSPDLFAGDHLLNLAEENDEIRNRSMMELQRVIDVTRALGDYFQIQTSIPIVASLGGFSRNAALPLNVRSLMYERIAESLSMLNKEGVEILPQTLPPFPWYFGGQLFCNLFVDPDDTVQFLKEAGLRACLDLSHSKLACNHRKTSFKEFIDKMGPYTAHLHIVDAAGVDKEGLQINEGDIDFCQVAEQLNKICPRAGFIPEIWQGHKNGGENFWVALDRLEKWL